MNENEWGRLDNDVEYLTTKVREMIADIDSVPNTDVRRMRRIVRAAINHLEEFDELTVLADKI